MGLWNRIRRTLQGESQEDEIREELEFHLQQDHAAGHSARQARLRLGNLSKIQEETREAGIVRVVESVFQDLRYGLRQLRKSPGLTVAVVLSLAIGLGANTAIFSLVDAAILRPLPIEDPDSLVVVEWESEGFPSGVETISGNSRDTGGGMLRSSGVSTGMYRNLANRDTGFETIVGAGDAAGVMVSIRGGIPEPNQLQYVSSNFFQGLGVSPALGRPFLESEDAPGQERVVIVSHRFWQAQLGADPNALNRTIEINGTPFTVVGVAPREFYGLRAGLWQDLYAPLRARMVLQPPDQEEGGFSGSESDGYWWVQMIGRTKPGVSAAEALQSLEVPFRNQYLAYTATSEEAVAPQLDFYAGAHGLAGAPEGTDRALWILMALVGVLLLIVCANVANLLLSRSAGRQRESAIRLAVGAGRGRVFRQHLIESGLFAVLGGVAGVALGYFAAQAIHGLFQAGQDSSQAFDLSMGWRVFGYSAAIAILTALLFGLAPAVGAARAELEGSLKPQTRGMVGGKHRLTQGFVVVQFALCFAALVGAGLLSNSLTKLAQQDIGIDRENLAYATVDPRRTGYSDGQMGSYVAELRERIAAIPGVSVQGAIEDAVLAGTRSYTLVQVPGQPPPALGVPDLSQATEWNKVSEGTLEALQVRLLSGRSFEAADFARQEEWAAIGQPAVVDEQFAAKYFPGEDPLGKRFGVGRATDSHRVIGVVADTAYATLRTPTQASIYVPLVPEEFQAPINIAIRSTLDSGQLAAAVRQAAASVDRSVPVNEFHTQTALIDRSLRIERLLAFVSGTFGTVALVVAAIGLFGMLAYSVSCRTNEIGVRLALGANGGDVARMILRDAARMVGLGLLFGLPAAYAITKLIEASLFGVEPADPATAGVSLAVLLGIAAIAAWIPARRAASVNPMTALREE